MLSFLMIISLVFIIICKSNNLFYFDDNKITTASGVAVLTLIELFLLLICVYFFEKRISFYFCFLALCYLFAFGQCYAALLYPNINPSNGISIFNNMFSSNDIYSLSYVVLFFSYFMTLGYFIKRKNKTNNSFSKTVNCNNNYLKIIGWILFVLSVVPALAISWNDIINLKENGYLSTLENPTGIFKVFSILNGFFPSAIILIFITDKSKKRYIAGISVLLFLLMQLIGGSRISVFRFVILFFVMWFQGKEKMKLKYIIISVLTVFLMSNVFTMISSLRSEGHISFTSILNGLMNSSSDEDNLFYNILSEAGNTQVINMIVFKNCPNAIDYCYGASIYRSFLSAVPNFGVWDVHPAMFNTDATFSIIYTDRCGLGSSIFAEMYWNFGAYIGCIVMLLFGVFIGFITNKLDDSYKFNKNISKFVILRLIFYMVFLVRTDINMCGRDFIYFTVFPLFIYYVLISTEYNRVGFTKYEGTHNKL